MIGEDIPDQHKQLAAQIASQIDAFFADGGFTQQIAPGVSAEAPMFGTTTHHEKLRARRTSKAPQVKALAEQGMPLRDIAKKIGRDTRTVKLIASENGIEITGT
ncbi:helix-turn-helix domain-containing protein [Pseudomonas huanghezhanensis]|uniref:helix-turn-helix domain-containing protein n=1 Tax=Pseudomonas huanghezhanensis TaxID=3002903 RepID=UPI002285ED7F|nr:helix-turn-helix domain-containing protein [Pseudomonas sp. BSw22131]